jgi:hypothetical protein
MIERVFNIPQRRGSGSSCPILSRTSAPVKGERELMVVADSAGQRDGGIAAQSLGRW